MLQFKIAEFIGAIRGAMERGVNEGGVVTEEMVSCVFAVIFVLVVVVLTLMCWPSDVLVFRSRQLSLPFADDAYLCQLPLCHCFGSKC